MAVVAREVAVVAREVTVVTLVVLAARKGAMEARVVVWVV
jgi:hypothetical protein